jgi:hypothetical protein
MRDEYTEITSGSGMAVTEWLIHQRTAVAAPEQLHDLARTRRSGYRGRQGDACGARGQARYNRCRHRRLARRQALPIQPTHEAAPAFVSTHIRNSPRLRFVLDTSALAYFFRGDAK